MSPLAIVAIAVGGAVLLFAPIIWLSLWLRRREAAVAEVALGRLREELPRRGWTYTEQDDSFAELYNRQHEEFWSPQQSQFWRPNQPEWQSGYVHQVPDALEVPFVRPPRADSARHVVAGTHRGRPFVAATLRVHYRRHQFTQLCVWVRTPVSRPPVYVRPTVGLVSRINAAIGQGDFRTGNVAFDDRFDVNGPDERFLAFALSPPLADFLLTDQRKSRGFTLFADHADAFDTIRDHRDPAELIPALDLRCDILDRIPTAAWA
ncbi:hypothetical protein GCM10027445_06950 [Amycolatopsis endophytica]|uniref:DUF3137 domain-containing protein n=1 Tax=Amycolatopsis endophytica TaxID=860233 RepID=A0A853AW45_9PSEU|nr:hypothetical protein [Amycolatopsis endophytica]NYI86933.1 hypothetical protein [Amycolatopsis endophytica]